MLEDLISIPFWFFFSILICVVVVVVVVGGGGAVRTRNHGVRKQTLNHLAKLAKWLSCVVSTYLYGAFDCMVLSCHVRVSEWICNVQMNLQPASTRC